MPPPVEHAEPETPIPDDRETLCWEIEKLRAETDQIRRPATVPISRSFATRSRSFTRSSTGLTRTLSSTLWVQSKHRNSTGTSSMFSKALGPPSTIAARNTCQPSSPQSPNVFAVAPCVPNQPIFDREGAQYWAQFVQVDQPISCAQVRWAKDMINRSHAS
jgi:hypothetical protein